MAEAKKAGPLGKYEAPLERLSRTSKKGILATSRQTPLNSSRSTATDNAAASFNRAQKWFKDTSDAAVARARAFNDDQARKRRP